MSFYDYRAMVEDTPIETFIVEFRDPDDRLISACLADRLGDGLSAVYSFFAPALERRSLGTHAILWLIERARVAGAALRVSRLLGAGEPQDGLQGALPSGEVLAGGAWRMLTDADQAMAWVRDARRWCRRVRTDWTAAASDAVTGFVQGQTRAITSRHRRSRRCRCRLTS